MADSATNEINALVEEFLEWARAKGFRGKALTEFASDLNVLLQYRARVSPNLRSWTAETLGAALVAFFEAEDVDRDDADDFCESVEVFLEFLSEGAAAPGSDRLEDLQDVLFSLLESFEDPDDDEFEQRINLPDDLAIPLVRLASEQELRAAAGAVLLLKEVREFIDWL